MLERNWVKIIMEKSINLMSVIFISIVIIVIFSIMFNINATDSSINTIVTVNKKYDFEKASINTIIENKEEEQKEIEPEIIIVYLDEDIEDKTDGTYEIIEDDSIKGLYNHEEYQQKINKVAKDYNAVGMSVALIDNGEIIDTFEYGSAIKNELPMTEDTKVRIASISKVFLGIATMISVEENTMSLDEDISKYWGFNIKTNAKGDVITPRSLLTHTSSIYDTEDIFNTYYNAMANRLKTGNGIRNFVSGNIDNYYYNNYAMDVLGMTIELANNKTLDDILSERIYNNLEIDAAFYSGDIEDKSNIATIYQEDGTVEMSASRMKNWHKGNPGSVGWGFAGGVTISVKDLGKIVALISNNGKYNETRYLSKDSIKELEYHEGKNTGKYWQCQPLCYETNKYGQEEFYYHTGSAYGVISLMGYNPITKQGIAVLTTGASKRDDVCGDVAEILLNIKI